jgi:hypothetical protein
LGYALHRFNLTLDRLTQTGQPCSLRYGYFHEDGESVDDDEWVDDDVDRGDAVSICSNDAPDDFAWYNNTLQALIVETIPFSQRPSNKIPLHYVEMPLAATSTVPPPTPRPSVQVLSSTRPTGLLPCIDHFHYQHSGSTFRNCRILPWGGPPFYYPPRRAPRHGNHTDCNRVRITNPFPDVLPEFFSSARSFFFLDEGITLRKGATVPSEGRRWDPGTGRGVYIEVVNPDDDRWVFPKVKRSNDAKKEWGHGEVPVGVVEWVRYLRGFYK